MNSFVTRHGKFKLAKMNQSKYFNASFNCYIYVDDTSQITFELEKQQIPMIGLKFPGTDIQSVQPMDDNSKVNIEGVCIPYQDHITFTGLLDRHGIVDIHFNRLKEAI